MHHKMDVVLGLCNYEFGNYLLIFFVKFVPFIAKFIRGCVIIFLWAYLIKKNSWREKKFTSSA